MLEVDKYIYVVDKKNVKVAKLNKVSGVNGLIRRIFVMKQQKNKRKKLFLLNDSLIYKKVSSFCFFVVSLEKSYL